MTQSEATALTAVGSGGSFAAMLAPASAAGPIGLAVAGATLLLSLLFSRKKPAQKIATTQLVDELEPILRSNLAGYMEGPRSAASQAAALRNFDDAWIWLTSAQACGNPELGAPGRWCIADRARGGEWDWFRRYRDPIAQDTPQAAAGIMTSLFGGQANGAQGISPAAWILPAAFIIGGLAL